MSNESEQSGLIDVREVARMLNCSVRTIYRLADAARMPKPVKLNALIRWRRAELQEWIEAGCPHCRTAGVAR